MKSNHYPSYTFCPSKMFLISFLLTAFLLITNFLPAQAFDSFTPFGEFTAAEIALKEVPFEKDANAVILQHLAKSDFNEMHNLVTEHRVKIKILNDKGLDNGDIHLSFYHKDDYEFLTDIDAVIRTTDANGQFTIDHINRKNLYTVKLNDFYSEIRFALPNVKAGSIFEYTYTSTKKSYGALREWSFQSYLPTITNFYRLAILPNAEFTYKVYKLKDIPILIDNQKDGYVTYKMDNIPSLQDEAFMDSRRDNLQHVTFQLSAYNSNGFKNKYISSWDDAARELLITPELGGQLNKAVPGTDAFIKEVKTLNDAEARTNAIYQFVQKKMSWNGYYGKYTTDGIKKAWDKGLGTNSEINMIFVNLLLQADVTACLLLANERDDGKIDVSYPFIDQFNKLVAYVTLPQKTLVIDASDRATPTSLVPLSLLNTIGYKIDKKNKGLMVIEDPKLYTDNSIYINGVISAEGNLHAKVIVKSKDYARLERKTKYKEQGAGKFVQTYFSDGYSDLKTDALEIENLENDSLPLLQTMHFTQALNTSGDYMFLNSHLFTGLLSNPFKNNMRFSDINFGSPKKITVLESLEIPEHFTADDLPKNTSMRTADTSLAFSRYLKVEDGLLTIRTQFDINRGLFERDEYSMLQDFYRRMFLLLNEQVVLKLKK